MKDELNGRKALKGIATIRISAGSSSVVKDVPLRPQPKVTETATARAIKRLRRQSKLPEDC